MMRSGPKPRPVAKARPQVVRASGPAVRKARPVRKAVAHRPARRKAVARRVAVAKPARVYPTPTPMPVAAARLATPLSYALVSATICETGPAAAPVAPPRLAMARAPLEPEATTPGPDTGTFAPPFVAPGPGGEGPVLISPGTPGNPPIPPIAPPGEEPPTVSPPVTQPPTGEPPVTPPGEEPPTVTPPPVAPPIDEPPTVFPPGMEPPIAPPPVTPVTPVPEPGTWALMILGFGLLGARLRRRREARV